MTLLPPLSDERTWTGLDRPCSFLPKPWPSCHPCFFINFEPILSDEDCGGTINRIGESSKSMLSFSMLTVTRHSTRTACCVMGSFVNGREIVAFRFVIRAKFLSAFLGTITIEELVENKQHKQRLVSHLHTYRLWSNDARLGQVFLRETKNKSSFVPMPDLTLCRLDICRCFSRISRVSNCRWQRRQVNLAQSTSFSSLASRMFVLVVLLVALAEDVFVGFLVMSSSLSESGLSKAARSAGRWVLGSRDELLLLLVDARFNEINPPPGRRDERPTSANEAPPLALALVAAASVVFAVLEATAAVACAFRFASFSFFSRSFFAHCSISLKEKTSISKEHSRRQTLTFATFWAFFAFSAFSFDSVDVADAASWAAVVAVGAVSSTGI